MSSARLTSVRPRVQTSVSAADSDSLSDYRDGLTGVKMAAERKISGKVHKETFTGKAAADWLMDCSTTVDRRETVEIGSLMVAYGLVEAVAKDKNYVTAHPDQELFQPTKLSIFQLTTHGKDLISGASGSRGRTSDSDGDGGSGGAGGGAGGGLRGPLVRDSNTQRLDRILNDASFLGGFMLVAAIALVILGTAVRWTRSAYGSPHQALPHGAARR